MLFNMFCVRGSVVFKNTWNEFAKHKNWLFPNFVNNSPKNFAVRPSRLVKQPNVENFRFVQEENRNAKVIRFSIETI